MPPPRAKRTRSSPRSRATDTGFPPEVLDSFDALGPVMLLNPDGTVGAVNRAALDLLGYPAEAVLGQPAGRFVAERKKERKKESRARPRPCSSVARANASRLSSSSHSRSARTGAA